ncbi:MAG: hypothetical protein JST26_07310 [Bacteroidetes bacterium]|nr:hypothetical protein [Bacteroidota bacterium]
MHDTVIIIDHSTLNPDIPYFNVSKCYYDSLSHYPDQLVAHTYKSARTLNYLDDSLIQLHYRKGIPVVNKITYNTNLKAGGQIVKDPFGYTEKYTVTDQRLFGNEVIMADTGAYRFHFRNSESKEATLKRSYIPRTYVWSSIDSKVFEFLNLTYFTDTDDETNEISVVKWDFHLKK